jgi:hypothetical protein
MNGWQSFKEWVKHPHGLWLLLFYAVAVIIIASAITLSVVALDIFPWNVITYILYVLAAISFGYTVYTVVIFIPKIKENITTYLKSHKFTDKMLEQYSFRTLMFTIVSLVISLGYALLNGAIGIIERSIWYGALSAYYFVLFIMRGVLLGYNERKRKTRRGEREGKMRETKTYLATGCMLIVLPICLSFAIMQMVLGKNSFEHAGLMIYPSAVYAFYKITMAIRNMVKSHRQDDYSVRAIRHINLADAFVSILALQTAMFKEFASGQNVGVYNAVTGGVVCALTLALGTYMIITAQIRSKKLKEENSNE